MNLTIHVLFIFHLYVGLDMLLHTNTSTGKFQVQPGVENFQQYAPGPGPGPAAWGAYDMQRAQGHR